MSELQTILNEFKNPKLNQAGSEIINNYKGARENLRKAQEQYNMALIRRWRNGKIVSENYEAILEECGTQREFAERIGITESMLSNDLRAYRAALDKGVDDEGDLLFLLQENEITPTTRNWEKLPRLLNEPKSQRQKDQRPKDEKRLEELYDELEEIKSRNENNQQLADEADYIQHELKAFQAEVLAENPLNVEWESEFYTDYIRNYGRDLLTGEPIPPDEVAHPHHVNYKTGEASGGMGNKLPDVFQIPVSSDNHRKIHNGETDYTELEYAEAAITAMANFIIRYGE